MLNKNTKEKLFAYVLLIPAMILLLMVIVIPLIESVFLSFTSTNLINFNKKPFIGIANYRTLFHDESFFKVLSNTLVIVLSSVFGSFVIGLLLALLLNSGKHNNFIRGLLIIPWLIPGIVIGIIWKWVLATEGGILNYIFRSMGWLDKNFPFLSSKNITIWIVVIVFIWTSVPYIMVTALAALQSVPNELEEAAIIDGADGFQRFRFVITPFIAPVLGTALILRIIYTMQDFAIIWSLTGGGPGISTETFVINVYKTAFNSTKIGLACAVGVIWLFVLLLFVLLYFHIQKKSEDRLYL